MTDLDEAVLRELLHRGTSDLHASSRVTRTVVSTERRRYWRNRMAGGAVTCVAAGAVVAVAATSGPGDAPRASGGSPDLHATATSSLPAPVFRLTAAQRALYRLGAQAAAEPAAQGRYVVLTENQSGVEKTSVIDSETGDIWTYQRGSGPKDKYGHAEPVPSELPVARHNSPTEAEFGAMPTEPAALRAVLLAAAEQQPGPTSGASGTAAAPTPSAGESGTAGTTPSAGQTSAAGASPSAGGSAASSATPSAGESTAPDAAASSTDASESDDDLVYRAASEMLWNPLVPPALRAAVFKVLATTPGVSVRDNAHDSSGRAAIAISRVDTSSGVTDDVITTYEDPATSGVLEQDFGSAEQPSAGGYDRYESRTRTDTFPANPYRR